MHGKNSQMLPVSKTRHWLENGFARAVLANETLLYEQQHQW